MTVEINLNGKTISVESEYNPDFVRRAKLLGGKWSKPYWIFDARDEDAVRKLCKKVYGTDGTTQDLVDVKVTVVDGDWSAYCEPLFMFGRCIARAFNRDSGAKMGDGVCFRKGSCDSGGSHKNWKTIIYDGSVFIIRDVERSLVKDRNGFIIEILDSSINFDALKEEKERLLARITEIDELLAQ